MVNILGLVRFSTDSVLVQRGNLGLVGMACVYTTTVLVCPYAHRGPSLARGSEKLHVKEHSEYNHGDWKNFSEPITILSFFTSQLHLLYAALLYPTVVHSRLVQHNTFHLHAPTFVAR